MPKAPRKLSLRIIGNDRDVAKDEHPRMVYPVGRDPDGKTCHITAPSPDPAQY